MTFRIVFLEPYTKNIHYNIHAMSVFPLLSWHTQLILHVIKIFEQGAIIIVRFMNLPLQKLESSNVYLQNTEGIRSLYGLTGPDKEASISGCFGK